MTEQVPHHLGLVFLTVFGLTVVVAIILALFVFSTPKEWRKKKPDKSDGSK